MQKPRVYRLEDGRWAVRFYPAGWLYFVLAFSNWQDAMQVALSNPNSINPNEYA
jgi:hypothetical protein